VGAAVVERLAAAVVVAVRLVGAATAEVATLRAGMGRPVVYTVMGRVAVLAGAAGFPSHFVQAVAWRLVVAAVALATLALPV
jgi:hypothetical protein